MGEGYQHRLALEDLRLQWSWAYLARRRDPQVLERLRRRVRESISQVRQALTSTAGSPKRQALIAELEALLALTSQMDRLAPQDED